ncbi:MAG: twin-arginine translocase TatA/TatE family subunit [Micrococcales bacterium]|nr:twin-arginine translocase TatA/TatE family subunit [Micrococcales bacterium]
MARFFENPLLIVVLVLVIIVVFGANKLPVAAKALGQSLRIFKNEVRSDADRTPTDQVSDAPSDTDKAS